MGGSSPSGSRSDLVFRTRGRLDNSPSQWVCRLTVAENLRVAGLDVSNPDADHFGGFLAVFDAFEVGVVYVSGDPKGTLTYNTFLRGAREEGSEFEVVRAGRLLNWGGVRADLIEPAPGQLFSETNDNLVAILLTNGKARILLAGDAEAREVEYMTNSSYMRP